MAVFYNIHSLPLFKNPVLTVGTFDGVHQGHRVILNEVVQHAAAVGGESVLITFDPHPRKLLFPNEPLGIITPLQEKIKLIEQAGIDHIVVVPFTTEFSRLSSDGYISDFLVHIFHPHSIVIGYDHRFGHDRVGDIRMLELYASLYQYQLMEIPAQLINAAAVSSTRIRNAIKMGDMQEAARMLGRHYSLKGRVVHGKQLGRTIGYPTANVQPIDDAQKIPAIGVYAIMAVHHGATFGGMLSIGYNPTVTDSHLIKIEANLFDFDKNIYGDELEIVFIKKLRDEEKFASLEALRQQLAQDKIAALHVLQTTSVVR